MTSTPAAPSAPSDSPAAAGGFGSAFRHPSFRFFWGARICAWLAMQMQVVAVGWQVYAITGDALHLGLVGLFQFLPTLALALVAGQVVDMVDRKRILAVVVALETLAIGSLCLMTVTGTISPMKIFAIVAVIGTAKAFEGPAMQAILSALVPPEDLSNAIAWNSSAMQTAMVAGPAVGGVLYIAGPAVVYGVSTVLLCCAVAFVLLLRPRRVELAPRAVSLSSLLAGITFIRSRKAILGAISLDMMAVLLGGATALLPVFARDVLMVGPWGLGLLRAAPAVGALAMAVVLARTGVERNAGGWMLTAVAGFGVATVVFGLSSNVVVSFGALIALGACDQISVLVRQTLIQLSTPDDMRGRVGAVSSLFIGASNQLGEFESGAAAAFLGAVPAVVVGGVGAVMLAGAWAWLFPELRRLDRLSQVR
ncbi:MFS family permease [Azospirillum fermentarium]|uniref:MFS transporter n=1 Tax=Azospirillum fermentarium TaxID=1233114 RepID=UPI0022278914|nr:MFS transporter [Azospirillum fermentarium]MCW2248326.1 MFS family permease [Azospirillum fermentarium]